MCCVVLYTKFAVHPHSCAVVALDKQFNVVVEVQRSFKYYRVVLCANVVAHLLVWCKVVVESDVFFVPNGLPLPISLAKEGGSNLAHVVVWAQFLRWQTAQWSN